MLTIAIWAFRCEYYFMFYVIEHYVDPAFKFVGSLIFYATFVAAAYNEV